MYGEVVDQSNFEIKKIACTLKNETLTMEHEIAIEMTLLIGINIPFIKKRGAEQLQMARAGEEIYYFNLI